MTQELATTSQSPFALTSFEGVEKMAAYIADAQLYGIKKQSQAISLMMMAHEEKTTIVQLMRRVHVFEDGKLSQRADFTQSEFERIGTIIWSLRTDEACCATFFLKKDLTDEDRSRAAERCELLRTLDDLKWTDPRDTAKERKVENQIARLARENEESVYRTLMDADARGISQGSKGTKTNWATSPRSMLQWRCVTEGVKVVAPGVLAGMPSEIELRDAIDYERKERARLANTPTISEGDVGPILSMIEQYDAELATDIPDQRRKNLQGLRMDLVCKLGDIGVKPPAEPEAPKPTVGGQPASTVETVVLPPEQPSTPKQPATRKQRSTPQPAATEDNLDMTSSTIRPEQGMETPWREFKCLRGPNPGIMFDHTLESIFITGKMAPDSPMKLDKLMAWFTSNAYHTSSDPHDKVLWAKAQEAEAELRAKFGAGAPATPASTPTTPAAEKPAQQPASPTRWQDFIIPGKHPEYSGKKLGDIGTASVKTLHDDYLPKIDWTKATLDQKKLKSQVALAMAELFPGKTAEDLPKKANEAVPAHTKQLLDIMQQKKWNPAFFITQCKLNGWLPEETRQIEDITAEDFDSLAAEWATVEAEIDKMHQPSQQP